MRVGGQHHAPDRFTPGKDPVPIVFVFSYTYKNKTILFFRKIVVFYEKHKDKNTHCHRRRTKTYIESNLASKYFRKHQFRLSFSVAPIQKIHDFEFRPEML